MTDLPPVYFPTCAVLLDDEYDFLVNFSLSLDSRMAYILYSSARQALRYIDDQQQGDPGRRYFSTLSGIAEPGMDHVIQVDLARMHKVIYNPRRFNQISVVLVDFAMPEMEGLEFCRRVRKYHLKVILLTGKADEKIAVRAFNEGLIDRVIFKSEADVSRRVDQAVRELQEEFFADRFQSLTQALTAEDLVYLQDKGFCEFFARLRTGHQWVEYYLMDRPKGFLLLDLQGQPSLMLLATQEDLRAHYEIAQDEDAPPELLEALAGQRHIPVFGSSDGYYRRNCSGWREGLHPAKVFHGEDTYYYAILDNPPLGFLKSAEIRSYRDFLQHLDGESQFGAGIA